MASEACDRTGLNQQEPQGVKMALAGPVTVPTPGPLIVEGEGGGGGGVRYLKLEKLMLSF
jgi:hypothetical protein